MAQLEPQQVGNGARVRAAKARRRLFINLAVAVVVIALAVWAWLAFRPKPTAPAGLVTGVAERADVVQTVSATGSVTAQTGAMVKIGSQITGRIKRLYADVGSQVQAGQLIAQLDLPDLEAQVQSGRASLAAAQTRLQEQLAGVAMQDTQTAADIRKAQSAVKVAQANLREAEQAANLNLATAQAGVRQAKANADNSAASLKRQQTLFAKGYVAAQDVDNARAQAEVSAAQLTTATHNVELVKAQNDATLASAREQVQQAEATLAASRAGSANPVIKRRQVQEARAAVQQAAAALAISQAQLAKSEIRTPISGTVTQLAQQEGETIAAGLSAPTVIIVVNLDRLQVEAFVDETDIGKVRLGQPAAVTVDAYPDHPFAGRVAKIASGATMQQNVVTYDVTISLDNPEHLLKPDMTATVDIEVSNRHDVLTVPVDAVKQTTRGSTVTVMRPGTGGKPAFEVVRVRTGISDDDRTEILSGLREGDTVVLAGQVEGMSTDTTMNFQRGGPLGMGRRGGRGGRGGGMH